MVKEQRRDGVREKQGGEAVGGGGVSPGSSRPNHQPRGGGASPGGVYCTLLYFNQHWLQGKHVVSSGVKYFEEGIRGTVVSLTHKKSSEFLSVTDQHAYSPRCRWQKSGRCPPGSSGARKSSTGCFLLCRYCGSAGRTHTHTHNSYFAPHNRGEFRSTRKSSRTSKVKVSLVDS